MIVDWNHEADIFRHILGYSKLEFITMGKYSVNTDLDWVDSAFRETLELI